MSSAILPTLEEVFPELERRGEEKPPHPSPLPRRRGRGDRNGDPLLQQTTTWAMGLLIVALVLGIGLRVVSLGEKSLWWDELMTVQRTDAVTVGQVIERLRGSPFPPLHYVIVHRWRQWGGSSNESLRLPSVLWGLAGLAVLARLGPELIGPTAARWSLVFAALSACHVWSCRDAKMYATVWTLSLISLGLFGTELESARPRWGRLAVWGVATGLLPWFSYVGLAVPAAELAFGLLLIARCGVTELRHPSAERRGYGRPDAPSAGAVWNQRPAVRLLAVGFVALLPFVVGWGSLFYEALVQRQGLDWLSSPAETMLSRHPLQVLGTLLLGGRTDLAGEIPSWGAVGQWLHGPLTLFVLVGLGIQACQEQRLVLRWLTAAVAVPVAGVAAVSLTWLPMWGVARYLVVIHPALILLLGRAMAEARPRLVVLAAAVGVLAFNLAWLSVDRLCLTRIPWERLAELSRDVALSPDSAKSSRALTAEAKSLTESLTRTVRRPPLRIGWESSPWLSDAPLAMPHVLRAAFSGVPVGWRAEAVETARHPEQFDLFLRAVRLPRDTHDPSQQERGLPFENGERVASFVVRGTPDLPLLVATVEVELWRRRDAASREVSGESRSAEKSGFQKSRTSSSRDSRAGPPVKGGDP